MALPIKRGDRRPYFIAALQQPAGTPVPGLDTATSITFYMRQQGETGAPEVTGACTILDVPTAVIQYAWKAGETDIEEGDYDVEVEVVWPGAEPLSFPTNGFYTVTITPTLHV